MSDELPLPDLIAFGNLRMATVRALSTAEADRVIAAIEARDAEITKLREENELLRTQLDYWKEREDADPLPFDDTEVDA